MLTDQFDTDGVRLLWIEEVAAKAGVLPASIKKYQTEAKARRRQHRGTLSDLPAARKSKRRQVQKSNGQFVTVVSRLWREDEIDVWLRNRRGPRGVVVERDGPVPPAPVSSWTTVTRLGGLGR
jgi:hypothetical protein